MIFDTHAHYNDEKFDEDRDELLASFKEGGVGAVCNVSCSFEDIDELKKLTERHDSFFYSVGIHPDNSATLSDEGMVLLEKAAGEDRVVAIGEIGLDYYWTKEEEGHRLQKEWFAAQVELAKGLGLPVIIHSRDAERDTYDVMKAVRAGDTGGVMHCYSYGPDYVDRFLDMGFYFGLGGVLTFKNAPELKEAASRLPMDRIVLETDCPYLAPVPFRGKRNNSLYLKYVAGELAVIKGMDPEEVERITWENALKLYRLDEP